VPPGYAVPGEAPIQPYQVPTEAPPVAPYNPYEGLAIAALVVSCAGVLGLCTYGVGGVLGLLGAIFGHVARRRIARNGTGGAGLALAGIIVGYILTGMFLLFGGLIILSAVLPDSP
jgi:hypothetical protein